MFIVIIMPKLVKMVIGIEIPVLLQIAVFRRANMLECLSKPFSPLSDYNNIYSG